MRLALTWLPLRPLQDLTAYETATLSWEEGTAPYVVDIIPSGSSGSVVRRAGSFLSASAADPKTDRTLLPPPPVDQLATLTNSTWDTSIDWFVDIDAGISV